MGTQNHLRCRQVAASDAIKVAGSINGRREEMVVNTGAERTFVLEGVLPGRDVSGEVATKGEIKEPVRQKPEPVKSSSQGRTQRGRIARTVANTAAHRTTLTVTSTATIEKRTLMKQYHYDIVDRHDRIHSNADSLSRRPCPPECVHCSRQEPEVALRKVTVAHSITEADERRVGKRTSGRNLTCL
ncbi:hypothetical protein E2C01_080424 [Portunus trituberculatus]|uniref:Peptidase A2 domain-containing protein n=1 Tax=Portunus trituberculatus TaxID=210409 RepID=A0A5B7IP89_PORTR|nr:hypothetical protein [Portunus trituberculatus]